jgi:hypothetical protein
VALAGCGGDDERRSGVDPAALLDAAASKPLVSANTNVDAELRLEGVPQLSEPITLSLDGPYVNGGGVRIPSFDWDAEAKVAGFGVDGEVVSTGDNVYLSIFGDNYQVGREQIAAVNERIAETAGLLVPGGVHPLDWFSDPRYVGDEEVGGVDAAHVISPLRGTGPVEEELSAVTERLGLASSPSVKGTIEAWIGTDDDVVRELKLNARLRFPAAASLVAGGASGARVSLDLVADDVGEEQSISPPEGGGFKPISELFLSLEDLGVPVGSLGLG